MILKFPSLRTMRTPMDHLLTHLTLVKSDGGISSLNRALKLLQRQCANTLIPSLWTWCGIAQLRKLVPNTFPNSCLWCQWCWIHQLPVSSQDTQCAFINVLLVIMWFMSFPKRQLRTAWTSSMCLIHSTTLVSWPSHWMECVLTEPFL